MIQAVKDLSAMRETQVRSLGWEEPLEKGMAMHFSVVAWRIPGTEEPGRLQSTGPRRVRHDWVTDTVTFMLTPGKSSSSFALGKQLLAFQCQDSRCQVTLGYFLLFWSIFWQAGVEASLGLLWNKVLSPPLLPGVLRLVFSLLPKKPVELSQSKRLRPLPFPSQTWAAQ